MTAGTPAAPPSPASLTGRWERSLLRSADGSVDTQTDVVWLQGPSLYVDLRLAPSRPAEGFAGVLTRAGRVFEWWHEIDLAPSAATDAGTLCWDGDLLVERGVHDAYTEHWRRATAGPGPCWGLRLVARSGQRAVLVRAGRDIGWACGPEPAEVSLARMQGGAAVIARSSRPGRAGSQLHWSVLGTTVLVRVTEGTVASQSRWRAVHREGPAA